MNDYDASKFASTVTSDYVRRRSGTRSDKALFASTSVESQALGHPAFDDLEVGDRRTAPMVAVFIDLTNFTGRTFWDPQDQVVDLAHSVLSGFIETITRFGGHPLGLRGDGLFAGFTPNSRQTADLSAIMAISACAVALSGLQTVVNPWLAARGIANVQARAGMDFGDITFVRTGSDANSEINPLGFAANFAAKCEKYAKSWEVVAGQSLTNLFPASTHFTPHYESPKKFTRDNETRSYRFYDVAWRPVLQHLSGVARTLDGRPTNLVLER